MGGWPPEKNAAFTWYFYIRNKDGDLVTGAAARDAEISKDGGSFTNTDGTEAEIGEGLYSVALTATEMNADVVALICKTTTNKAKTAAQVIYTTTQQLDDLAVTVTRAVQPQQNIALSNIMFLMVDDTDHVTPKTGLTVTGERSIDAGAFAAVTGTIAEISDGIYQFDASAADMNGAFITFRFSGTAADDTFITFETTT